MVTPPQGPILTAAEMRAAELDAVAAGTPLSVLMDQAGQAVANAVLRFAGGRETLILCGPGNNGGDGYVAARLLKVKGHPVRVAALDAPKTDLARAARALWDGAVADARSCPEAPVLVDALFGTGLTRRLEGEVYSAYLALTRAASFIIAVDLPSGLGTDDGAALGAVQSHLTLALGALKPAHLLQPGAQLCGTVLRAPISADSWADARVLERPRLIPPGPNSHKYKRGYAVVAGGAMGGAAMLAARSAMRRAGYVALTGARRPGPDALVHRKWDAVAEDSRVGALLIGPGLGRDEKARAALTAALLTPHRLVLDADALMLLTAEERDMLGKGGRPVILTPHEGEFVHLFGTLPGSKIDRARAAAEISGAVVILKGADTVIAAPSGAVRVAPAAPSWLASAGTGDVLAGLCVAALSAYEPFVHEAFEAACEAVWLHGEAARRAGPALIADDLPDHIPAAMEACL
jgi:hydroxyethylthiazole kinase-like uncharacterized protein yjeF